MSLEIVLYDSKVVSSIFHLSRAYQTILISEYVSK